VQYDYPKPEQIRIEEDDSSSGEDDLGIELDLMEGEEDGLMEEGENAIEDTNGGLCVVHWPQAEPNPNPNWRSVCGPLASS